MSIDITVEPLPGATLVAVAGRLDSATSDAFEKTLLGLYEQPAARVLLDCGALAYVSSAGLRVVLMAAKRARQGQGRLVLCGLSPNVREVFEISGFVKILDIAADRAEGSARVAA